MAYKLKNQLSQAQYDELMHSSLDDTRSLLNDLFYEDHNNSSYTSYSIRILSNNEYNKCLMNSSLNGSITIKNENVWHFCDNTNSQSFCFTPNSSRSVAERNVAYCLIDPVNFTYWCTKNGAKNFGNFAIIYEIINNNTNRQFSLRKIKTTSYDIAVGEGDANTRFLDYIKIVFDPSSNQDKSFSSSINNILQTSKSPSQGQNSYIMWSMYSCFRPVFQYVDNNKSTNIYY